MTVTLIITTYNNPGPLEKVFQSVLEQVHTPDEVIVADDGSDERTAGAVRAFASRASFPVLHEWQENRGFRAAMIRNKAIRRARSKYIILLDGDCVVDRRFVADHLALAESGSFIQGKRILVTRRGTPAFDSSTANSFVALLRFALTGRISNVHHLIRLPFYPSTRNHKLKGIKSCNMSFFRADIIAVNGFNEEFIGWGNEDSELACRFFKYGLTKKVHPFMMTCFHLWHPSHRTRGTDNSELLQATQMSDRFVCSRGIAQYPAAAGASADKTGHGTAATS